MFIIFKNFFYSSITFSDNNIFAIVSKKGLLVTVESSESLSIFFIGAFAFKY